MVIAGPGTGKTQIVALRIANILNKTDAFPENILCLTFTESGVKAMRERLSKFIGPDAFKITISTFHGFANEIIQSFPEKFAFAKDLLQLDDLKRIKIIQEIIDDIDAENTEKGLPSMKLIPFHDKYSRKRDITAAIQNLKKESIRPENLKLIADRLLQEHEANIELSSRGKTKGQPTSAWKMKKEKLIVLRELATIYENYQTKLKADGFYDYEDMILFVIDKFSEDKDLLAHYQEKYLYIHVDEYQDTNGAQNEIVKLLGSFDKTPNIFVVGDDDQAIYRFQGANLGNILFFAEHFDGVKKIPTPVNYRSTQIILDLAESVIKNNTLRLTNQYSDIDKKLISHISTEEHDQGSRAKIWEFNNGDEENITIAKEILKLKENGVNLKDIAIIYRKNIHSEDISSVLNKFGVPTKLDFGKNILEAESVSSLINLLTAIYLFNKNEDQLLYQVMSYEFMNIPAVTLYKLCNFVYRNRVSMIDVLLDQEKFIVSLPEIEKNSLTEFLNNLLEWNKKSINMKLVNFVELIMNESGLIDFYLNNNKNVRQNEFSQILSLNSFFKYIQSQAQINKEITLKQFLDDLTLSRENSLKINLQKVEPAEDSVNLLTAHSSKGLEFEYVFIIKATNSNWGKAGRDTSLLIPEIYVDDEIEDDDILADFDKKDLQIEDERRLFFVALTRAKRQVYITYANEYAAENSKTSVSRSMFIEELDKDMLDFQSSEGGNFEVSDLEIARGLSLVKTKDFSQDERDYLIEQVKNFKLSASSLNCYLRSPKEFKEQYLIRVPQVKDKSLAMGTSIHRAMEYFNKNYSKESIPSFENLRQQFEDGLYKEFFGDDDYERTKVEGLRILESYYNFYLKTGNYQQAIESEYNFNFHKVYLPMNDGSEPVELSGRIDKLELLDASVDDTSELGLFSAPSGKIPVKVVDYKTGSAKTKNDILGKTSQSTGDEWRQIVFYKLLGDLDKQFRPGRNFSKPKYDVQYAEIDFMKMDSRTKKFRKELFMVSEKDVKDLTNLIFSVIKSIRALDFPEKFPENRG